MMVARLLWLIYENILIIETICFVIHIHAYYQFVIIEKCCRFEANTQLGPVPRKTVKFNPGLCEISSLQNTVEPLLRDTVMIYTKCFSKQCIGR